MYLISIDIYLQAFKNHISSIIKKTFKILVCNTGKELLSFLIRRCKLQIVNKSICLTAQGQFKNDQIALPSDIQDNLVMIKQKTLGKQ